MSALRQLVFLPLPLGEGRGEGLQRFIPQSAFITMPALTLTLSQREREQDEYLSQGERGQMQGSAS
jgi:hypothetical protein